MRSVAQRLAFSAPCPAAGGIGRAPALRSPTPPLSVSRAPRFLAAQRACVPGLSREDAETRKTGEIHSWIEERGVCPDGDRSAGWTQEKGHSAA